MARLNSWLSADVLHALGWALIHSLWQCLGVAALAAILMTLSRRPSIRYLIATGALVAMLAAPVVTFFILMTQAAPVHVLNSAKLSAQSPVNRIAVIPSGIVPVPLGAGPRLGSNGTAIAAKHDFPSLFLSPNFHSSDFLARTILPWLVAAWLCGVALFSLRLAGGFLLLEHRRRRQSSIPGARILALCHELQRRLGLNRAIRYLECGWLQTPAVIGWIRPIILLPVSALTGLSEAQLRAVIAHELAHIRRHDFFVNLLQILIETVLFYHPAIWWLNRRIRAERELCCDEIAISLTGDRLEYAKVLTLMAEWDGAPALAMAANRGPLSERIFHILGHKSLGARRRMLGLTGSVLFLAAALGAANALFGIAYPIPMANAKTAPKAVLPTSRIAVAQRVHPFLQVTQPVAKSPDESSNNSAADPPAAKLGQSETNSQAENPAPPAPDLSRLLPLESLIAPTRLVASDPPLMPVRQALASLTRTCALPAVADKVDLRVVAGSDLMTVPVQINGATKQFLFDFGTDPTEISDPTVGELHLPQIDRSVAIKGAAEPNSFPPQAPFFEVKGAGTPKDYQARVRIAAFTIGDATVHDLQFLVANDRDMGRSAPYDGRLTRSHFPQYDIDLDFGGKQLSFLTSTSCTDADQVAYWPHTTVATVPITLSDGKIQVQMTIQGHLIDAVIDTGSAHTVMRRDVAERIFGLKVGTAEMTLAGDLRDGADMPIYTHIFSQISFAGGVTANNIPTLIQANSMAHKIDRTPILGSRATFAADPSERIPDLTLGMDVLHQLHLYAAFDQNKLYVTSAEPKLYASSTD